MRVRTPGANRHAQSLGDFNHAHRERNADFSPQDHPAAVQPWASSATPPAAGPVLRHHLGARTHLRRLTLRYLKDPPHGADSQTCPSGRGLRSQPGSFSSVAVE